MQINVVGGLIIKDGKILIGCRHHKDFSGYWEFPGGKVEKNESDEQCLKREIKEELNVDIKVDKLFMKVNHKFPKYDANIRFYFASLIQDSFVLKVHSKIKFVKALKLHEFKFLPSNLPVIVQLNKIPRLS